MIGDLWNWFVTQTTSKLFSTFADVIGVVSAIIGLLVLVELKRIRGEIRQRRDVASLSLRLNAHVEAYQKYLRDMASHKNEISEEFARVENSFQVLVRVARKQDRQRVQNAIQDVKRFQGQDVSEDQLRRMHREMIYFEGFVARLQEEFQWQI